MISAGAWSLSLRTRCSPVTRPHYLCAMQVMQVLPLVSELIKEPTHTGRDNYTLTAKKLTVLCIRNNISKVRDDFAICFAITRIHGRNRDF